VRKYKLSTSSTESIIFKVLTSNMGEMLHKIRKQVSNVVTLVTKIIFKEKFDKYKSSANVSFGVR